MGTDLKQVGLQSGDEEFKAISRCFHNSMPYYEILSIEKVFNPSSWNSFKAKLIVESNKNPVSCLSVRSLFHGSIETSPHLMYLQMDNQFGDDKSQTPFVWTKKREANK